MCLIIKEAPLFGMKISSIDMDDNVTTNKQLQEDTGKTVPGTMATELVVTKLYTDPNHREKLYNKGLHKKFSSDCAKQLAKYYASWVSQMKSEPLEVKKHLRQVPVLYTTGNHSVCGENDNNWCLVLRDDKLGKVYTRKPVFNVNKNGRG